MPSCPKTDYDFPVYLPMSSLWRSSRSQNIHGFWAANFIRSLSPDHMRRIRFSQRLSKPLSQQQVRATLNPTDSALDHSSLHRPRDWRDSLFACQMGALTRPYIRTLRRFFGFEIFKAPVGRSVTHLRPTSGGCVVGRSGRQVFEQWMPSDNSTEYALQTRLK